MMGCRTVKWKFLQDAIMNFSGESQHGVVVVCGDHSPSPPSPSPLCTTPRRVDHLEPSLRTSSSQHQQYSALSLFTGAALCWVPVSGALPTGPFLGQPVRMWQLIGSSSTLGTRLSSGNTRPLSHPGPRAIAWWPWQQCGEGRGDASPASTLTKPHPAPCL